MTGNSSGATYGWTDQRREKQGQLKHEKAKAALVTHPPLTEGQKKCTRCGQTKYWNSDKDEAWRSAFSMQTRVWRDGTTKIRYPTGECKTCAAARAARNREKLDVEERSRRHKIWNRTRDKKKAREYHREYSRIRRDKQDSKAQGARVVHGKSTPRGSTLNAEPLLRWLEDLDQTSLSDTQRDVIRKAKGTGNISLQAADEILTALSCVHAMVLLYPPE